MRDALPRRADGPGDRAAAAGAHAARRRRRPSARRGGRASAPRCDDLEPPSCAACTIPHAASAVRAPAVERPLRGDADRRRLGLQPLGRLAVTRWREDATRDDWGSYVFLRDVDSGEVWSAGYQPSGARARQLRGHVRRGPRRVRPPRRRAHHDARRRRLARGRRRGPPRVDHQPRRASRARSSSPRTPRSCWRRRPPTPRIPAFSKLFVQTEYRRRSRAPCWRRAGRARPDEPRALGCPSRRRRGRGDRRASSSRPTAPASSAAARRRQRRSR